MAKPKPSVKPHATSVTIPVDVVEKINKLTDNKSAWIRGLIDKEIARVERLNRVGKNSQEDQDAR